MSSVLFLFISIILLLFGFVSLLPNKFIELNDVLDQKYKSKYFNGTWISDDSFIYKHNLSLYLYNLTLKEQSIVLNKTTIGGNFEFVSLSDDLQYALFIGNSKGVFRHSTEAQYKIMNLVSGSIYNLDKLNYLQLVEWIPNTHDVIFVKKNNLYSVIDNFQTINALTKDGIGGIIYNGISDWVYEEEVLSDTKAFWFSDDGKLLSFIKFNDSDVHQMDYIRYGTPGTKQNQYPEVVSLKYPKAGTANPTVQLFVISLESYLSVEVSIEDLTFPRKEAILTNVVWAPNNDLGVTWNNRIQNEANIFRCKIDFEHSTSNCRLILNEIEKNGWVELLSPIFSIKNEQQFIQITPLIQEDYRHYSQLVLYNSENNSDDFINLSFGKMTVTNILGWDQQKNVVFYEGVKSSSSTQSHVYMYQLDTRNTICLTEHFNAPCLYGSITLSKNFTYFALTCKGRDIPFVHIYYTYVEKTHPPLLIWEDNKNLRNNLMNKNLPIIKDITIPLENNFVAIARMYLPHNYLEVSSHTKYPLLLNVYGGPGSNINSDKYLIEFHTYLVTKRNIIVVKIDGRGSQFLSKEQQYAVYRNLGKYEIKDQITSVKYLRDNFDFIDKHNIGVWGWSYGGFATGMILSKDVSNIFKCGISVAPVTNFLYYDSIYTERYMGLPTSHDNEIGYSNTDITRNVQNFANKTYFLIHGNADDNVHYQQSMMLAKALEKADILFQQQSYPDENHSIKTYTHHVFHSINRFWTKCFDLDINSE